MCKAVAAEPAVPAWHDDHRAAVVIAVGAGELQFAIALGETHAFELVVDAALLRIDAALDALAHGVGLAAHLERAPLRSLGIFAFELPAALGHGGRRGPVGEHDAPVGAALLVNLRRAERGGRVGGRSRSTGGAATKEQADEHDRDG